jgi:hypothetical protein
MNNELASVEFNIRTLLTKVINMRSEYTSSKKIFNYKKISMLIEDLDNELTAQAPERKPLIISNKKRRRNHAIA